jgi:arabinofuranosyltransferase
VEQGAVELTEDAGSDSDRVDRVPPAAGDPVAPGTDTGPEVAVVADPVERRAAIVVWVVLGAAFLLALWSRRWISDDGFINLRIVDNVLDGHGPVFNPGERVEAGTSQLWLLLLVVGRVLLGWALSAEWIAVVAGLACSVGALAAVAASQWRAWARPVVPVALLAWVPLGGVWDFSSSGLENPLLWLWSAGCFGALAVRAVAGERRPPWQPWWLPVLLGLGPLIRPDAALYTVAFLAVLLLVSNRSWRGALGALGLAAAAPAVYEVFRMGFFGAVVPNTAIAKEAGGSDWSSGGRYLLDFLLDGWLWIPLSVVVALAVLVVRAGVVVRPLLVLWSSTWAVAALHAVWVVRVGGDFMHARLLLADWFLVLLPLAALPVAVLRRVPARLGPIAVGALLVWAGVVWAVARQPLQSPVSDHVYDERTVYSTAAGDAHPVTLADHGDNAWTQWGEAARERAERGEDVILRPSWQDPTIVDASRDGTVLVWPNIGMLGYAAGGDVHVVDPIGLSDAFAARMEAVPGSRIGHEKSMPLEWVYARWGVPDGRATGVRAGAVAAAGRALACPPLQDLLNTTTAPMNPRQFVVNLLRAPSLTLLEVPRNAQEAVDELC